MARKKAPNPFVAGIRGLTGGEPRVSDKELREALDVRRKSKKPVAQTGAAVSAPKRGGWQRGWEALERAGVPRGVTQEAIALDQNLLGLDATGQSLHNILGTWNKRAEPGAEDYLNVALATPIGGLAFKPVEKGLAVLGRGAINLGRRALGTRAGRYLTEARPLLDSADDAIETAFTVTPGAQRRITNQRPVVRGLPAPEQRLGLPAPFTVPVVPADKTVERRFPTLNVSDRGGQMRDYERYTEMVPISWLEQLEGNELRYGGDRLRALSEDIATRGIANPLILSVGKENSSAILGEGNHRLAAARMAGMTHVPARVAVGDKVGSSFAGRSDLVPLAGKYFPSQAKPSDVFTSLQEGSNPGLSYLRVREPEPMDPELRALLDEFNAEQLLRELETKKARGGLAVKRKKKWAS